MDNTVTQDRKTNLIISKSAGYCLRAWLKEVLLEHLELFISKNGFGASSISGSLLGTTQDKNLY